MPDRNADILGALVTEKIQDLNEKSNFYGIPLNAPSEKSWKSKVSLSLEQFLDNHPLPRDKNDIILWGMAWECYWGKKPPAEILRARNNLIDKAKNGGSVTENEKRWLILISTDTDIF